MEDPRAKFQRLLRDMFQFDCADLDFGIYRIMNLKRDAVERFIRKDLLDAVGQELSRGILAGDARAAEELKELAEQIRENFGEDALDGDGVLAEKWHGTPPGKRYLAIQARASGAETRPALEAAILNHLHAFFSRYYDAGDFLSKRRYSRKEKYAIPYNGEEVHLHWANSDQYYVKTAEYFTDYRFTSRGITVHFRLRQADVPQDNVKGDKRFFMPLPKETEYDAKAAEIVVPFECRPLTNGEQTKYGRRNQQDAIVAEALEAVPAALKKHDDALAALLAVHHKTAEGEDVTFLAHHLRQYTRKNTSDFFVHKDLKGFLTRELDFYLKNEVLNLDELEAAGETRSGGWFQLMRVIKSVGGRIIDFLAQIEDFQKMLFEKRKFVTETNYCITMQSVPEEFYPEVAACEAQWSEWKDLFHVDEEESNLFTSNAKGKKDKRVAFLKGHPTLVLDTKHFDRDFVDRLLASFDDIDEMTDGLLVHGENFQALSLLLEKYRDRVKCIYIDPPYNTGNDAFLYRDTYQHSSWLAMMRSRLALARDLLSASGVLSVSINDIEQASLRQLLSHVFGPQFLATIAWQNLDTVKNDARYFSTNHEYLHVYAKDLHALGRLPGIRKTASQRQVYKNYDDDPRGAYLLTPLHAKSGSASNVYTFRFPNGQEWRPPEGTYPRYSKNTLRKLLEDERIWLDPKGKKAPQKKTYLSEVGDRMPPVTFWDYRRFGSTRRSNREIQNLLGRGIFPNTKPSSLVGNLVDLAMEASGVVCDFFAGSGTTAHAVLDLVRRDGIRKQFVLAELAEYCDTVILPRVKRVTFSPEWKDGKPKRMVTDEEAKRSPRIVKYVRLESYEDALNNITFAGAPKTLYDFDDYVLRYMLQWETKESATLLNVEQLASPFSYTLRVTEGQETDDKVVDLPETFAYLLGLHVKTRRVLEDKDRRYVVYRGSIDHREVVVIWRDSAGWEKADFERDKKFVAEQKLTEGADEVFVNGDSLVPKARSLDGVFKARMFSPVGA